MGFFSRRTKTTVLPQHTQTSAVVAQQPQAVNVTSPPPSYYASTANLHLPQQQSFYARNDGFISTDNFNTIQQLISQDAVDEQFSNIIANIDEDRWDENGDDFSIIVTDQSQVEPLQETTRALVPTQTERSRCTGPRRCQKVTIWSKVSSYSNSRLPTDLPPLRVYIPTWPLICLAAQYSASAYKAPGSTHEREAFVSANARLGTKAMVIKSVPCDDKKTLVFAIRGTSTLSLRDWNVNLQTGPVSPSGFLDDEGNLCHAGFLKVAKAMIKPIAMRLRTLLEENPSRASCSLLITGHSAGGAVAALLFSHMLSSIESELSILTGCFKRVHCVTFGAPPVTLLPLSKPPAKRYQKSLFFGFMNEGDPVVRAEKAYIRSLVDLLSSPLPEVVKPVQRKIVTGVNPLARLQNSVSKLDLASSKLDITRPAPSRSRYWLVPEATLSNAGRLVLLRVPHQQTITKKPQTSALQRVTSQRWERNHLSNVTAHTVTDEQLRNVIFGDPTMHAMEVYLRRVDMLALKAVTARG